MISYQEAHNRIAAAIQILPVLELPLLEAINRTLSAPLQAPFPMPRFNQSAVDGYAVRAQDVESASNESPVRLHLVSEVRTGSVPTRSIMIGEASKVYTGAMIPFGANTVIMIEDAVFKDDYLRFDAPVKLDMNIRHFGEEFMKGDVCLNPGVRMTPAAISLAASLGLTHIPVRRAPRVALIVTGNELVEPGEQLEDAQVYDSNRFGLLAALDHLRIPEVTIARCKDDIDSLTDALTRAIEFADLVITSGGASVGDVDFVKPAISELGGTIIFDSIAIKPGKPVVFANLSGKILFGLPGNPVSALVTFLLFVKPALQALENGNYAQPRLESALLTEDVRKKTPRTDFVRATAHDHDGKVLVSPCRGQDSHMLGGLATANSLIVFDGEPRTLPKGSNVEIVRIEW